MLRVPMQLRALSPSYGVTKTPACRRTCALAPRWYVERYMINRFLAPRSNPSPSNKTPRKRQELSSRITHTPELRLVDGNMRDSRISHICGDWSELRWYHSARVNSTNASRMMRRGRTKESCHVQQRPRRTRDTSPSTASDLFAVPDPYSPVGPDKSSSVGPGRYETDDHSLASDLETRSHVKSSNIKVKRAHKQLLKRACNYTLPFP